MEDMLLLFSLVAMDQVCYKGTLRRYIAGAPAVANADLSTLKIFLLDDGHTTDVAFKDLVKPSSTTALASPAPSDPFHGLPAFLQRNSKLIMDHEGSFHKGFLQHTPQGGFTYDIHHNLRSSCLLR